VRQFRYEGLTRWRLHAICAGLPLLLQISLALFLIGLADFLLNLSSLVGPVVASAIGICLLVVIMTIALSTVVSACPFRSPLSLVLKQYAMRVVLLVKPLYDWLQWSLPRRWRIRLPIVSANVWVKNWRDIDLQSLQYGRSICSTKALGHVWSASQDHELILKVTSCFYKRQGKEQPEWTVNWWDCWSILDALGGIINAQGRLNEEAYMDRISAIPSKIQSVLADLLLTAMEYHLGLVQEEDTITSFAEERFCGGMHILQWLCTVMFLWSGASEEYAHYAARFVVVTNLCLVQEAIHGHDLGSNSYSASRLYRQVSPQSQVDEQGEPYLKFLEVAGMELTYFQMRYGLFKAQLCMLTTQPTVHICSRDTCAYWAQLFLQQLCTTLQSTPQMATNPLLLSWQDSLGLWLHKCWSLSRTAELVLTR
jgi:hypothetical protein